MKNVTWSKRLLALCLTAALLLGMAPGNLFAGKVHAVTDADRSVDPGTYNAWMDYFPTEEGTLNTKESGAVWTDKSVFEPGKLPANWTDVSLTDTGDNFMVALSALAANKQVKGYSNLPTDTMLILDVSGSMGDVPGGWGVDPNDYNDCAEDLTVAADAAIKRLLELNDNNRVGVVLYSGSSETGNSNENTGVVLLPLGRYTANSSGKFLTYSPNDGESVSIANGVTVEDTTTKVSGSKSVDGGTYIQNGIWKAAEELLDADTVITEGVQTGMVRMPIMVLMTDGAPTTGTTSYTDPQTSNIGNGQNTSDLLGFVTQLTAAYSKAKVEEHYGRDAKFYTLGLEVSNNNIVQAVLDPANHTTTTISNAWTQIMRTWGGDNITVSNRTIAKNPTYINANTRYYVDEAYEANSGAGTTTGAALLEAFEDIVDQIVIQSRYYPTLVDEGNPDVDGYVTFRDEIGLYMEVASILGIRLNGELHTGERLAVNFVTGGGDLGTTDDPEALGNELVWAIQKRLGIETAADARALLGNAYAHGQLSYDSATGEFSNYIGWFGDEDEKFVDFWYEGMPESQYPADAVFINRSYLFLGDVDTAHGIASSDMMYTTVRIRERIKASDDGSQKVGEVIVDWSIPAALVPTITYEVELNGDTYDSGVKALSVEPWINASGNTVPYYPIRLMYEVALRSDINELNILEKTGGQTTFYTNAWSADVQDTSVNTFSHFEPSKANERFYFTEAKTVLVKSGENYVPYTGESLTWAENTYYHEHVYFDPDANSTGIVTTYEPLTELTVGAAGKNADNTWSIPIGTIHRYYHDVEHAKVTNVTGTNAYSLKPFIRYQQASGENVGHYYVTSTLGNNGKLTVTPATGILLTKELAEGAAATDRSFYFEISGGNVGSLTVTPVNADGTLGTAYTATVTGGKATVELKAGETVYVTGMTPGADYTVTELADAEYVVDSVLVNGAPASNPATVTPTAQTITSVDFTNHEKGQGGLYITKTVTSATSYPAKEFELTVELQGNANDDFTVVATDMTNPGGAPVAVTGYTYSGGIITGLKIVHGQTIQIHGLTEGTVATVTETAPGSNFTLDGYTSRDYSGAAEDTDNIATIHGDRNAVVTVFNSYAPSEVEVNIGFEGIKNFDASLMTVDSEFTFELQQYVGGSWVSVPGATATVEFSAADPVDSKPFTIPTINLKLDEVGTYPCQILEVPGSNTDITYDANVYTFGVVVTDNGDGTLKAEVVTYEQSDHPFFTVTGSGSDWTVSSTFNNEYHTAATYLDMEKKVEDLAGTGKTPANFHIATYRATVEADGTWTRGEKLVSYATDAVGEARIAHNYDNSDFAVGETEKVYHFIVAEVDEGKEGWSYDATEYRVTVTLTRDLATGVITSYFVIDAVDENGNVTNVVTAADNTNHATLAFENTFEPDELPLTDKINTVPAVLKQLVGRELNAGEFNFQILGDLDGDGNFTDVVAEGTNEADGAKGDTAGDGIAWVTFTEKNEGLTFTKVGTYYFKILEVGGTLGGVTYSPVIYDMVVTVTEADGKLAADYYFEDATGTTVTFVNTYSASPATIELEGTKTLTGGRTLFNGEFTFDLVEMTDSTFATAKADGLTLSTSNTGGAVSGSSAVGGITFPEITYTATGTYYYKVTERAGGLGSQGVTYTTDVAYITVTVTDPGDGQLSASASYTMATAGGSAMSFVNTYKAQPANTDFSVTKELSGRALNNGEFTFALYEAAVAGSGNWSIVGTAVQEVTNAADGTIDFAALTFEDADVYYYIVKEIPGTLGGITYDDIEYRITITVTDDWKGRLQADVEIVDQDGVPYEIMIFNNVYATDDGELKLQGSKTLVGRDMLPGETFTFTVKEGDTTVSTGTVTGGKNGVPVAIDFSTIEYTLADVGEHTYVITEEGTDGNGMTCSKETFTVKVTVSDNGDGTLKVEADAANPAIAFTNTYAATGEFRLEGATKVLEGRDMFEGETFTFEMKEGTTLVADATVSGMKSGETAQLTFDAIQYTLADLGEHTYTVTEVDGGKSGLTYSDKTYTIVVTVTDNGDGTLKAEVTGTTKGADVVFNNTYTTANGSLVLTGTKTLTGRDMAQGETFTFQVREGTELVAETTVTGAKAGVAASFTFAAIEYTLADVGEHTYTVTEVTEFRDGVTFDTKSYTVKVTVSDNGDGTLKVTPDAGNPASLDFTNAYAATGEFKLEGATKTLTGRDMFEGETFTFEMKEGTTVVADATVSGMKSGETAQLTFDTIQYTQADVGEHTYTVTEVDGGKSGLSYSDKTYTIVVTVTDNGDGTLKTEITGTTKGTDVVFANTYAVKETYLVLTGTKTLTGRDMEEGETFTFEVKEGDKVVSKGTAKGGKKGKAVDITFTAIHYTAAGEHTYTVTEVNGGKTVDGVTFDDTSYTVKVTVTDNGDGTLTAAIAKDAPKLTFKNSFKDEKDPPKTGDSSNLMLYSAGLFAALAALFVVFASYPRKKGRYER